MSKFRGRGKRWAKKIRKLIWKGFTSKLPNGWSVLRRSPGSVKRTSRINIPRRSIMNECKRYAKEWNMTLRQYMDTHGQYDHGGIRRKIAREYGRTRIPK